MTTSMRTKYEIVKRELMVGTKSVASVFSFLGWNSAGSSSRSDFIKAYAMMPWLSAIVGKISDSIGSVPWYLEGIKNNKDKWVQADFLKNMNNQMRHRYAEKAGFNVQGIFDHPMLTLLRNPNPYMSGLDLFKMTEIHLELTGAAYWYVSGNSTKDMGLYPIPPGWVMTEPKTSDGYYSLVTNGPIPDKIHASKIVAFRIPDPGSPYSKTLGHAVALRDELEADEYAAKHIKSFFENGAVPDLIISGTGLGPGEEDRAEERWLQKLKGYMNAHRPHFLRKDVTVTQLGSSFKDIKIVDLRKWQRDLAMQFFGIPPEILGVLESSNRATISAASYLFAKEIVIPRLDRIKHVIQSRLVPFFDAKLLVEYISPVEEDREFRLKVMEIAPWCWEIDEWRKIVGDKEMDNGQGKHIMVPSQYTPILSSELSEFVPPYQAPQGGDDNAK